MQFQLSDVPRILPELMLLLLALLVLGSDIFERWASTPEVRRERARASGSLAAIGLGMIFVIALIQSGFLFTAPQPGNNALLNLLIGFLTNLQRGGPVGTPILGAFATDNLTMLARLIFIGAALLVSLLAYGHEPTDNPGEFYSLLIFSTLGMCCMAAANELIFAYIALELSSIALYVLAGYFRGDTRSNEAGLKYFVIGALSSGILLYGMSLTYGFTAHTLQGASGGFTQFENINTALVSAQANPGGTAILVLGMLFVIAGLGYKVAMVPFHAWAPDVYQGAPTLVTAFLSTASKTAGFLLIYRLLVTAFAGLTGTAALTPEFGGWQALLAVIALLTVLLANLAALPQTNAKRLLAYSSVSNAGFVLLALLALGAPLQLDRDAGTAALVYYLLTYTLTNIGAFGVLAVVGQACGGDDLQHLNGLAQRNLPLAALMSFFILSLAGIPPLAGFFAKLYVFMAGYQAGALWLVVVAILTTLISLFYYLRFLRAMFIEKPASTAPVAISPTMLTTLSITAALVLITGIFPGLIIGLLQRAASVALGG